jgi:hypothetical protein
MTSGWRQTIEIRLSIRGGVRPAAHTDSRDIRIQASPGRQLAPHCTQRPLAVADHERVSGEVDVIHG